MKKKNDLSGLDINTILEKVSCRVLKQLDNNDMPYILKTNIFSLDLVLSEKEGFTSGCIELYGAQNIGKSSFALSMMAEAQKIGLSCFYINMERGITSSLVRCFNGLDSSKVFWVEPEHGQAAVNAIEQILRSTPRSFIVLDSVPACISSAQLDEGSEHEMYAPIPRLFSNFMPKVRIFSKQNESTVLLLNQIRDNVSGYGPKKIVPGGNAIKFYCDWRIGLKREDYMKDKAENITGHKITAITEKNRFYKPFRSASFYLVYGKGFDSNLELLDVALQLSIIKPKGAWYSIPGLETNIQGQDKVAAYIAQSPELQEQIKNAVRAAIK